MKIRIFGKDLFEAKSSRGDMLVAQALGNTNNESKYLLDFTVAFSSGSPALFQNVLTEVAPEKTEEKLGAPGRKPKEIYELRLLHDEAFKVNLDPVYIDGQIAEFKDKLGMLDQNEWDMRRGVTEVQSIIIRMENRKKYSEVKDVLEEFPYTTGERIEKVLVDNAHLQRGLVSQFIADMPKEATAAMKKYDEACVKLCGKKAVFYVIADKKDFKKTERRRDPILLAQSPIGHFWQILGAWDEEMLLLENL